MRNINRFIGEDNWSLPFPTVDNEVDLNDKNVVVLRGILFFYKGEKTKLSKINKYFTQHAIDKMIHDKFIEIYDRTDNQY